VDVLLKIDSTIAAVLVESGKPLVVEEIQLPKELFSGQVLVEVITSGLCGAQINEIEAVKGPDKFLPHLLGHEGFARVIEIGPGVTTVVPGDHVVMHWRPGTGIQAKPPSYIWQGKQLNAGWVTTLNKHAVVSENRITRIEGMGHDKNSIPLLGCALTTALGVLENDAQIGIRDSLLIFGAGGVGLLLVKLAKLIGLKDITVVDIHNEKLIKAQELGARNALLFQTKAQTMTGLQSLYGKGLPSVAIDTTGNTNAIEICYEMSSVDARVILVGVPRFGDRASIYTLPLHFGKVLTGSEGGQSKPARDIPHLLQLVSEQRLNFDDYPTHSFSLSEVNDAILQMKNGITGRMIIDFEKI
jgi:S-(hydroxymethyl)glutathione dehydrogenase/alcohol dehydrogenase